MSMGQVLLVIYLHIFKHSIIYLHIYVDHCIIVSIFDRLGVDIETEISSNRNMNVEVELVGQVMRCLENQDFWCTTW